MDECPKCKTKRHQGETECKNCGIVFERFEQYLVKRKGTQYTPAKKKPSLIIIVGGGFIGVCVLFGIIAELTGMPKSSPKPRTEEATVRPGFSGWDGSNRSLEKIIKDSMHDPSSYAHDKTSYWDLKDHLIVKTTFRGKNAFGAVVKNTVSAKTDLQGNVIEIISRDDQ